MLEVMQFTVFYLTRFVQHRRHLAPRSLTSSMTAMDTAQRSTYLKRDTPLVYSPETSRSLLLVRLHPCSRNPALQPAAPRLLSRPLSRPPLPPPPVPRHLLTRRVRRSLLVGLVMARRPMPSLQQSWFIGRSSLLMRISRSLRTKGTR